MQVQAGFKICEVSCLHDQAAVDSALQTMAEDISAVLAGRDPLLLCVMNGGVVTFGQLLTRLDFPLQTDFLHVSRYGSSTRGGELEWKVRPETSLKNRVVLVVDDILDEGGTLAAIMDYCRESGATSAYSAVLVEKVHARKSDPDFHPDFVGLEVEDRFLVGCGMDYRGYLRNLPGIYAVESTSQALTGAANTSAEKQVSECEKKT